MIRNIRLGYSNQHDKREKATRIEETVNMTDMRPYPNFVELSTFIKEAFDSLRAPYMQWANLARLVVQGLPYDVQSLVELETYINDKRIELRKAVLIASEHFPEEHLELLRNQARMSKFAWRMLKSNRTVNIKHGFTLVSY